MVVTKAGDDVRGGYKFVHGGSLDIGGCLPNLILATPLREDYCLKQQLLPVYQYK